MPCKKCGEMMIDVCGLVCPLCDRFPIFNYASAQEVANKRLEIREKIWENNIEGMDKMELLKYVFEERKCDTLEFFNSLYNMDLVGMLTKNQLLQKIMKMKNMNGLEPKKPISSEILKTYELVIDAKRHCHHIKSRLEKMLCYKKYRSGCMSEYELLENFEIFYTEEHVMLEKNCRKYNLVTGRKDDVMTKKRREDIEEIQKHPVNLDQYTSEERVKILYDLICSLYIGLLQDDVFRDGFNLESYKKILVDPDQFEKFISTFKGKEECDEIEFLCNARNIFKKDIKTLRKLLLFEESNPDIFPCFMKITNSLKKIVLIDYKLCNIMFYILHAIIIKKSFDEETARRGKEFENRPNELFKKYGFKYFKNKGIKNKIEIDGIAVKDNFCFIIEVKGKMLPILFMDQKTREKLIRDVKGVVDGYKYTKRSEKKIPSMMDKIEYVKENYKEFEILDRHKIKFCGIVVLRFYQWIPGHNGVKFMTDDELEECLSKKDLSAMMCNEKY